ncbi:MAG: PAS domain-containing protein [Sulfurospirillum sp.]
MFRKTRHLYRLKDIEKILVYFPIFFILLLSFISFFVSFLVLDFNKKSQLNLISQKSKLQESYENTKLLQNYIDKNTRLVNKHFKNVEKTMSLYVHEIEGVISGLEESKKEINIKQLQPFLKERETKREIKFVIFRRKDLRVLYGLDTVKNIQKLIFNNYNNQKSLYLTLLYISSQGKKSSFYWKNDLKQTIQVNYFEYLKKLGWYIGAFSISDDLKKFTARTFFNSMSEDIREKRKYYFYFYDYNDRYFYNYFGEKKWRGFDNIFAYLDPQEMSFIKTFASRVDNQNGKMEKFYDFYKYSFGVGMKINKNLVVDKYLAQKQKIEEEFQNKKRAVTMIILAFAIILIFASFSFANFIKKIFSTYNKRFEAKNMLLSKWKERYELAIIATNDGLWDINFKNGKIFFSNTWLDMFGYKRGDVNSYNEWLNLIHKDDRDNVIKKMDEHSSGKLDHFIAEYRLKTKLGRYKWTLSRGKIFFDDLKKPDRLLMMAMNIVERKRIERSLDDTWRLVKEGDIVLLRWLNDEKLTVTFVSESILKFGYYPDDLLQKSTMYADIIYKDDLKMVLETLRQHIENGLESFSCTYRIKNRDDESLIWVFSHAIFIKDDFGNVTDLYGYIYDITAIKQSEQDLENRVKEEVDKNIAKDRLLVQQNKLAAMGEMIGAIAHQWRQPLNNVSLILHFVRDNFDNEKLNKEMIGNYLDKGKKQIEYMSHTIDDFRNFYKPSKTKERFEIKEALEATVEIMSAKLEQKDVHVEQDVQKFILNSFENEFKQAVLNIISNAKDAIFQEKEKNKDFKGIIYLIGKKIANTYEITISNNGGEIEKEVMDRIFEPYFTTKFEKQGTGIGLYMTKMIIENSMAGFIDVRNIEDGVEFKIILPIEG